MVQLALDRVRGLDQSGGLALQDRAAALVMKVPSPRPPSAASTVVEVKHEHSGGHVLVVSSGGSQHFKLI